MLCFVETKFKEEIQVLDIGNNKCRIWRRDKGKLGGGVMRLVRTDVGVEKEIGEGMTEVINIKLNMKQRKETCMV